MAIDKNSNNLPSALPSPLASRKEKSTKAYGLAYARMMYNYYTRLSPIQNEKIGRIKNNRKYAEGLQSILDVTQRMGIEDTSHLNLDLSPVNYIAKIVDISISNLMKKKYMIAVEALDPESKLMHEDEMNQVYAAMLLQQIDREHNISGRTGIPLVPKGMNIPQSDEEAELYFALNGKNKICLAMETAIKFVLANNDLDLKIARKLLRDLLVTKSAAIMRDYDEDYNIKLSYVDVADLVYPYSKTDTFDNIPYVGVNLQMEVNEIGQLTDEFTPEQLCDIAKTYQGRNNNPAWNNNWGYSYEGYYNNATMIKPYWNFNISVMRFWFLSSSKEEVVKVSKKGKICVDTKTTLVEGENKEHIGTKEKQWRYEGYWIIGSNYIFNYKESENIPRERIKGGYSPKTMLPIDIIMPDIYDMENKSMVEKAIEAENQLNLINQKIQQYCIAATPPGWSLNMAVFEKVKIAGGRNGLMTPDELYKLGEQTGKFLYYAKDSAGNPLNINPIGLLPPSFTNDLSVLINLYNLQIRKINDVMGYNDAMNGQIPNSETAVGTQEFAMQGTQNVLQPIYLAFVQLMNKCMSGLGLMIQDSIQYNKDGFMEGIGLPATVTLEHFNQIPLATLGIQVQLAPDEQKIATVMNLLTIDIKAGKLNTSDYLRVEKLVEQSPTEGASLLVQLENKRMKEAQDAKNQDVQNNMQSQMQSTQVASQLKQQEIQLETQAKIQLLQSEYQLKGQFGQATFEQQMALQKLKNEGADTVAEISAGGHVNVQEAANRGKVVAQQIQSNTEIAKEHIVHHSSHTQLHHEQQNALELQENEPPEKKEEVDKKEKRYIVGKKAYKESVLRKHGHDISKLKEYK